MKIHLTVEGGTIRRSIVVGVLLWLGATAAVSALAGLLIIYAVLIPQWRALF